MILKSTALFAGIALVLSSVSIGQAADAGHGEQLARRWCAACHIVAPDQTKGADNVSSFASLAQDPDFSALKIAFFLLDPHPKMPDMALTRKEAEDLAAYIAQLKH